MKKSNMFRDTNHRAFTWATFAIVQCLVWVAADATIGQTPVQIDLRADHLNCVSEIVTVADVAVITGGDEKLRQQIASLDLDKFQVGQSSIQVTAEQVRYRLRFAHVPESGFQIFGYREVMVRRSRAADIRQIVEHLLVEQMTREFAMAPHQISVTVDAASVAELRQLRLDPTSLNCRARFPANLPLGNSPTMVTLVDGAGRRFNVQLTLNVSVYRDLVIAKQNIAKGQQMTTANVQRVRRPVSSNKIRFASYEETIGRQAEKGIQQYSLVSEADLKDESGPGEVVIKRRERVRVQVQVGNLKVMMRTARALEDGRVDDYIEIENLKSRRVFLAKVVRAGVVEVTLE